jgi:glycosyltransferase involved in cell wall biosynthesis
MSPPITGAALASEDVVEILKASGEVTVIPYQRGNLQSGSFSLRQVLRILACCLRLACLRVWKRFDRVYLVVSSSVLGNLRDLLFLLLMGGRLRRNLVVHLHGANFDLTMKRVPRPLRWLNRRLLGDIRAAIVLGDSFRDIFEGYVPKGKVAVIKNYFDASLLIPRDRVAAKFGPGEKVRILYLSNLMPEKGYRLLLDSFLDVPPEVRQHAELHFAGTIRPQDAGPFLERIAQHANITYHGCVVGEQKRDLFWSSQIFCLPTLYRFEGQPISILEAYAAGCLVLTTGNGGIRDVFRAPEHGFSLDADLAICQIDFAGLLTELIGNISRYQAVGSFNRSTAEANYQKSIFAKNILRVVGMQ